jgi:hypothetical protein
MKRPISIELCICAGALARNTLILPLRAGLGRDYPHSDISIPFLLPRGSFSGRELAERTCAGLERIKEGAEIGEGSGEVTGVLERKGDPAFNHNAVLLYDVLLVP